MYNPVEDDIDSIQVLPSVRQPRLRHVFKSQSTKIQYMERTDPSFTVQYTWQRP
jgi:hypothetical protein